MYMCLNSQGTTPQPSAEHKKHSGESPRLLTPKQIRAGINVIMAHAERQAFWKNSELGRLLGFDCWPTEEQDDKNQNQ